MAIAVEELRGAVPDSGHGKLLELVALEIQSCKRISSRLTVAAGSARAEGGAEVTADRFISGLLDKSRLMQPWIAVNCRHEGSTRAPKILADASLEQALLVLLQSPPGELRQLDLIHSWDDKQIRIQICDRAPRPARGHLDQLLARATIERFGGTVADISHPDGGDCIELRFPLSRLAIGAKR
jgi:hypothetical protein